MHCVDAGAVAAASAAVFREDVLAFGTLIKVKGMLDIAAPKIFDDDQKGQAAQLQYFAVNCNKNSLSISSCLVKTQSQVTRQI